MEISFTTALLSFFLGLGLAASAGFRVFVPLLVLSIFAHLGEGWIHLNENWQWIGSTTTILILGAATLIEILAYYLPFIDNLLDTVSVPLAGIAGTILMASTLTDMNEVMVWALAIIAGGGTATAISGSTAGARALSTGSTGGTGNFLVNTGETFTASVLSITSFIWAPLAFILVLVILFITYKIWKKNRKFFNLFNS